MQGKLASRGSILGALCAALLVIAAIGAGTASAATVPAFGGCHSLAGAGSCVNAGTTALAQPLDVAVSSDGLSVYTVSFDNGAAPGGAIASFNRAANGDLSYDGCISDDGGGGCANANTDALRGLHSVTVSQDDRTVYVASSNAILQFTRSSTGPTVGDLTYRGCINATGTFGCGQVVSPVFGEINTIEVSPDNRTVYTGGGDGVTEAASNEAIGQFNRDITPGPSPPYGDLNYGGCLSNNGSGGACADLPNDAAFEQVLGIATNQSSGGDTLFATTYPGGGATGALTVFDRDSSSGTVPPRGDLGFVNCFSAGGAGGCTDPGTDAISDPQAVLAVGNNVYAAGFGITQFSQGAPPQGPVTYDGCVSFGGSGGTCGVIPTSSAVGLNGLASSPDGRDIYASSLTGVLKFTRDLTTGDLTYDGCLTASGLQGCRSAGSTALDGLSSLAGLRGVGGSGAGNNAYATSQNGDAVVEVDLTTLASPGGSVGGGAPGGGTLATGKRAAALKKCKKKKKKARKKCKKRAAKLPV